MMHCPTCGGAPAVHSTPSGRCIPTGDSPAGPEPTMWSQDPATLEWADRTRRGVWPFPVRPAEGTQA